MEKKNTSQEYLWRWYDLGEASEEDRTVMDGLCQPRHESHRNNTKMKSMTELAGGELCVP